MGPIETAVKAEIGENSSALAEIAYKLAFTLDEGEGSTSMVRELRSILAELRQQKPWSNDAAAFRGNKAARMERKRQAKWVMMREGKWEWDDDADDWVRVDQEGD